MTKSNKIITIEVPSNCTVAQADKIRKTLDKRYCPQYIEILHSNRVNVHIETHPIATSWVIEIKRIIETILGGK